MHLQADSVPSKFTAVDEVADYVYQPNKLRRVEQSSIHGSGGLVQMTGAATSSKEHTCVCTPASQAPVVVTEQWHKLEMWA